MSINEVKLLIYYCSLNYESVDYVVIVDMFFIGNFEFKMKLIWVEFDFGFFVCFSDEDSFYVMFSIVSKVFNICFMFRFIILLIFYNDIVNK